MPAKKDETKVVEATEEKVEEVKAEVEEVKEEKKEAKAKKDTASSAKKVQSDDKHGSYYDEVEVVCICGAKFTVNTTVPGPIKVETCSECHPTYNKDKVIKKVVKGRLEKFLEKQKKIDAMKK